VKIQIVDHRLINSLVAYYSYYLTTLNLVQSKYLLVHISGLWIGHVQKLRSLVRSLL